VAVARQAAEQSKEGVAFLLGIRGQTPRFGVDVGLFSQELPSSVRNASADSMHELAYARRPDVQAQRLQVSAANLSLRLARRQIVPDISIGFGYVQQGAADNTSAVTPPTPSIGLSLTLPAFYQQQGEITMANANLRSQQVLLAKLEAQVLSDVDMAWSAFSAANERRDRLEHGYLDQAKLAADLTRIQYEKGAASLVDYLIAEQAYIATVQEHVQSLNDLWTALFQLEAAVGAELNS
jgi:cobalt-zinc-cadmium efflux system outer membrane protein